MPGVVLFAEVSRPRGLIGSFAAMLKSTLAATAAFWHERLLIAHFGTGNRARFGHAPRRPVYRDEIKKRKGTGQGKFVDDVLTGKSKRFMLAFSTITATSRQATVTLRPPAYFARPYIGPLPPDPRTGRPRRITQQPDKPAEITAVDGRDAQRLAEFAADHLERQTAGHWKPTTKRIRG